MGRPFFSVVVPTRNRPQLAMPTVKRLLAQTWTDFEIVVLENSDQPSLKELESYDSRVRVFPAATALSMPDNWQRGLDLVKGEYVIYVSDKDWVVDHALDELAAVVRAHDAPAIVNTRRAVWFPPDSLVMQGLLMQQGTGQVAVLPSRPVIQHWFDTATNLMNAPMIYNSVVRRDFLETVRRRYSDRLFFGNSPDVGSGQILLANTPSYVVLDRVHIMAVMGPWSIGWATITKGRGGAAAGFASEFGANPLDRYGLVWSLTGVVVETLLACQEAEPELLGSYRVNWDAYRQTCFYELQRRAAHGDDIAEDMRKLEAGSSRTYAARPVSMPRPPSPARRWLTHHTPIKFFMPPFDGWRRRFGLAPLTPPGPVSYRDSACFRPLVAASTPEEAAAYILREQQATRAGGQPATGV